LLAPGEVPDAARNADELLVVDCLLPGQVRRLGSKLTYLTPRRPVKTSARDCEIRGGEYVAFDRASYADALRIWLPAAQQGDPEAQTYVGEIFEKGLGLEPDYEAAAQWYRRAAEQGYGPAQIDLGQLYEEGRGVPRDAKQALVWYRRASGLEDLGIEFVGFVRDAREQREVQRKLARSGAEVARLRKDVRNLERRLAAARTGDAAGGAAATAAVPAATARLQREADKRLAQYQASVAPIVSTRLPGPSIQLVEPALVATRSIQIVSAPGSGKVHTVVGRVDAPAGLMQLLVNGVEVPASGDGFFEAEVRVRRMGTPVSVVAIDDQGKRNERNFVLRPDGASSVPASREAPRPPSGVDFGRYHALVIGNSRYRHLPELATASRDARAVSRVLESRYGFEVTTLIDADRYQILSAFDELRRTLDEQDNLVVYYAGHGALDEVEDLGYWMPVDAEEVIPTQWISNVAITEMLNAIAARHVMVVADSCYSGVLGTSSLAAADEGLSRDARAAWQRAMVSRRSRTALTSGGLAPVLDEGGGEHSVFARAFLDILRENDDVLEGRRLFEEVAARVTFAARERGFRQEPQYAPIRYGRHEVGDFFLVPQG